MKIKNKIKNLVDVLLYKNKMYFKSNKYIVSLLRMLAVCYYNYNQKDCNVVEDYNITCGVIFFLMVWIGMSFNDEEDDISQQLMILRLGSERKFYIYNNVMLIELSAMISAIAVFFPVIKNIINSFSLYDRPLTIEDVLIGYLLHLVVSFTGAMLGSFFHKRIFKDQKTAICILGFITIISYSKYMLYDKSKIFVYIGKIFPPMSEFATTFLEYKYYHPQMVIKGILMMLIYGTIVMLIKDHLLIRNKF